MTHNDESNQKPLLNGVRRRREREETWRREGERSLMASLGVIGLLGWLIVIPILGGLALGRWLDGRLGTGITFTGALLVAGAVLGWWLAWRRIHQP